MSHVRKVRVRRLPVKADSLVFPAWSGANPFLSSPALESLGIVLP